MLQNHCIIISSPLRIAIKNIAVYSYWINLHTDKLFYEQVKLFANEGQRINSDIIPSTKQKDLFKNFIVV